MIVFSCHYRNILLNSPVCLCISTESSISWPSTCALLRRGHVGDKIPIVCVLPTHFSYLLFFCIIFQWSQWTEACKTGFAGLNMVGNWKCGTLQASFHITHSPMATYHFRYSVTGQVLGWGRVSFPWIVSVKTCKDFSKFRVNGQNMLWWKMGLHLCAAPPLEEYQPSNRTHALNVVSARFVDVRERKNKTPVCKSDLLPKIKVDVRYHGLVASLCMSPIHQIELCHLFWICQFIPGS